jgi:hypothetical protein
VSEFPDVALTYQARFGQGNEMLASGCSDWEREARERVEDDRLSYAAAQRRTSGCSVAADWL